MLTRRVWATPTRTDRDKRVDVLTREAPAFGYGI